MKRILKDYLLIVLGCIIAAFGTSCCLLPNKLSSGGFSGIATILYYFFNIPMGATILIMNIPLFIVSYFRVGKEFILKSAFATFFYSYSIDFFNKINIAVEDQFLNSIYGGVLVGIGLALTFKVKASTGGTDLIINIIKTYNDKIKTSNLLVIMDGIIVGLNLVFFRELEIGLYSVIAIIIIGRMIDIVFEGINFSKMIYIISDKYEEIATKINHDIDVGATGLYGKGIYTDKEKMIVMCVTKRRNVMMIKHFATEIDPFAFIIISDVREVFGLRF